jgi:Golgi phosphoprotein 3
MKFTILERLFILSINDEQGAVVSSAKNMLRYGLAGALLVELALANKIHLEEGRLGLADPGSCGHILMDDFLAMVAAEEKPRKIRHWLEAIDSKQTMKHIAGELIASKVISFEKNRYRLIIPFEGAPQGNATAKYWIKQHLRGIVLAGENAEASDLALLNLMKACHQQRLVFTRDERKFATKKIDALAQGQFYDEAVVKLLADIEKAVAIALDGG